MKEEFEGRKEGKEVYSRGQCGGTDEVERCTCIHTHLRLQVLDINTFLENFLHLFDGVSHAVLRKKGVEYLHSFSMTSAIQLVLLLCEVGERRWVTVRKCVERKEEKEEKKTEKGGGKRGKGEGEKNGVGRGEERRKERRGEERRGEERRGEERRGRSTEKK